MSAILYEVCITVDADIRDNYLEWLRNHAQAMLALDGFTAAEIFIDSDDANIFVCQYRLQDGAAMDAYLAGPADRMRADGQNRFGGRFKASRRIAIADEAP